MRHSLSPHSGAFRLAAVLCASLLAVACAEDPTGADVDALNPAFNHSGGHAAFKGGPPVSITITQEPTVGPNTYAPGNCVFPYAFDISAKGKVRDVRWITHWMGGAHDGAQIGSNTTSVGSNLGAVSVSPTPGHPEDGHSFTALRIRVQDPVTAEVFAEVFTAGATMSCP